MRTSTHPLETTAEEFDAYTAACVEFVREHLLTLDVQPSFDLTDAAARAAAFREALPEDGTPLDLLLARLHPAVTTSFNTAGPGYLAFIPGGGIYSAALADYIACSVNRYVGVHRAAPALVEIERTAVRWLAELMGYPPTAEGLLTTGGSLSNLIALVTARVARLPENFFDGVIYVTEETHSCVAKAARVAGFPARALRQVPVDARYRMRADALATLIAADRAEGLMPFCVVASVGTTNTGAIDPLEAICDVAAREGLWVHADAAYGGFFRLADGGPALMPGLERCDSVTLDPHKGLFLPYGTGCLLVRDPGALACAHASHAAYLRDVEAHGDAVNFADISPELSRDFRGLRVWLPFMLHGVGAFRDQLTEKLALTRDAHERLARHAHFEILDAPQLTVIAFRLRVLGVSPDAEDACNAALLDRVNARLRVFLSSTVMNGRTVLRICVLSFRTHHDRIDDCIRALEDEAAELLRTTR